MEQNVNARIENVPYVANVAYYVMPDRKF